MKFRIFVSHIVVIPRWIWKGVLALLDFLRRAEGALLIIGFFLTIEAVKQSAESINEASMSRYVTTRSDLYGSEAHWTSEMAVHPTAYGALMKSRKHGADTLYIQNAIIACLHPSRRNGFEAPKTVYELRELLWSLENIGNTDESYNECLNDLRRAYDLSEMMFYQMERCFSSWQENVLDDEEANTWLGYGKFMGPTPMLLLAAEDAREHGFVSSDFARWFADTMSQHERWNDVRTFYPDLVERTDDWVADFETEDKLQRFLYPKGRPHQGETRF